jgi:hypothetical protein
LMMAIDQGNLRRKQKNSDGNSNENWTVVYMRASAHITRVFG